jgi:L,D-transpeptidase ErfK/SrfK
MRVSLLLFLCGLSSSCLAATYPLPSTGNVIGQIFSIQAKGGDTLYEIGKRYDVSLTDMQKANPLLKRERLARDDTVIIPSEYILPDTTKQGIVINISELRLYYYHPDKPLVSTYPISIGQEGWATPVANTFVTEKTAAPSWHVPESIRAKAALQGKALPTVVPPGPDNPLGDYAIRLSLPGYLIHGTRSPNSIGKRASHGCIRMWDSNVEELFNLVQIKTPVYIVHQPYKIGLKADQILLESDHPLSEEAHAHNSQLSIIASAILQMMASTPFQINWDHAEDIANKANGVPTPIGNPGTGQGCSFC